MILLFIFTDLQVNIFSFTCFILVSLNIFYLFRHRQMPAFFVVKITLPEVCIVPLDKNNSSLLKCMSY